MWYPTESPPMTACERYAQLREACISARITEAAETDAPVHVTQKPTELSKHSQQDDENVPCDFVVVDHVPTTKNTDSEDEAFVFI